MFKGLCLCLLSSLAVACAPDRVSFPATMAVSPEFAPDQIDAIFAAADAWNEATGGVARLELSVGDSGTIRVVPFNGRDEDQGEIYVDGNDAQMSLDLALTSRVAHHFRVADNAMLQDTVMHELGHAFGLSHHGNGLMQAEGYYTGSRVDTDTLQRFCVNYGCRKGSSSGAQSTESHRYLETQL